MKSTIFVLLFLLTGTLARHGSHEDLYKRSSESEDEDFQTYLTALSEDAKTKFAEIVAKVQALITEIKEAVLDLLQKLLDVPGLSDLIESIPILPQIIDGTISLDSVTQLFSMDTLNQLVPLDDIMSIVPTLTPLVDLLQSALNLPLSLVQNVLSTVTTTVSNLLSIIIPIP